MIKNIQHDYFIWDEKSSIEPKTKLENKTVKEDCGFITEINNDSTQKDWKDIIDPKERTRLRNKAYKKNNRDKIRIQNKSYRENNKDKYKDWYEANKNKRKTYQKEYGKKYWRSNRKKINATKKKYYEKNKEIINSKNRLYKIHNKDKLKINYESYKHIKNERKKERFKCDINYKLKEILRSRIRNVIKKNKKAGSAVKDLGCTVEEFKTYLESKFQPGMTWENHGLNGWHIDHIKPLASFDLTNRQQFLEACHYTNLQPLWAKDNIIKSDKILTIIQ
jgi:hypothetical protein